MKFSYLFYEPITDLAELTRRMHALADLGYQGVELTATHPLGYAVADLVAASRRTGMPVVSLLSGWSYGHERLCLATADETVRERAVQRLVEYVELAGQIGALLVVGLMQGLRTDEPDPVIAQQRIAAALSRVARVAEQRQVTIVIEPVNHLQVGFHHTAAEVAQLLAQIGSPAVTLMLDSIHMHIEERSPTDTIRQYAARVGHFHLCESNGGLFGEGNLHFAGLLSTLRGAGYQKYVSIKVYRHASWLAAARQARDFLHHIGWTFAAPHST